ncbi:MAG: hypothetical protein B7Z71_00490 [Acidocella sp. 21-58-7]|nr:MAG: hypothetical protein B7Z71_00490 [Acidocella sp. 21-58-7]HQT65801.1 MbcA/ParS/Xre antitoxin family protein [Acidocella sp.]
MTTSFVDKTSVIEKLVRQLELILEESGNLAGFDARGWLSNWLREPLWAFGGRMPIDFLNTIEGQALVSQALSKIQSGAF